MTTAKKPANKPREVTPAAEWPKRDSGTPVTLPSGAVVRLRKPPLQYMMATGRVPPKLWVKMQKDGFAQFVDPVRSLAAEDLSLFVDWMIAASFVEPVVAMTRKAGTVYIGDVCEADKEEVMEIIGLSLAAGIGGGDDE
jgi:hypothetical protein